MAFVLGALLSVVPTAAGTVPLDTTPPSISYTIDGITGTNGWYRGSTHGNFVVVHWTVTDPDSTVTLTTGCEAAIRIDSSNTGTTLTRTATSDGGTTSVATKTIKVDAEQPTGVAAAAMRAPDYAGWSRSGRPSSVCPALPAAGKQHRFHASGSRCRGR